MLEIDDEVVARSVSTFDRMVARLDELARETRAVRDAQGATTWSTLPAAQRFATTYGDGTDALAAAITTARTAVAGARDALTGSVDALAGVDQGVFDQLQRFQEKPHHGPPMPDRRIDLRPLIELPLSTSAGPR